MPQSAKQRDRGTGGRGKRDRETKNALSLCLSVSLSLCLSVSLSLWQMPKAFPRLRTPPPVSRKGLPGRCAWPLRSWRSRMAPPATRLCENSSRPASAPSRLGWRVKPSSRDGRNWPSAPLRRATSNAARSTFRRAIARLPDRVTDRFFEEVVIRIPFALSARGYRNEAVEMARELERRFAGDTPKLAALGEFYMTIEATGDAIRALESASKLAGDDAKLGRLLGAAYRMGLRLDDAIAKYRLATSLDAGDKRAHYDLANLYRAQGDYAGAVELYRKQLEIVPNHSSSYKGLALAYLAQGDEELMKEALNQARDLRGPDEGTGDVYLQTQLAFHYLARNRLKEARQAATAALSVEPRYSWAAHRRRRSRPRRMGNISTPSAT